MKKPDKKNVARIIALALAVLMILGTVVSAIFSLGYAETMEPQYDITATMQPDAQAIRCEQTTVLTNGTDGKLSQLFFFCYLNAYRRESTLPFDAEDMYGAFEQGYAPGVVRFLSVRVNGEEASWGVQGEDECFLRVAVQLEPGESAEVAMEYELLLPACGGFAGAGLFDWRLTNAFPTLCPYENGTFLTNGVLSVGRFAFAEPADWRLELLAPEGWQVIAGGAGEAAAEENGMVRRTFEQENARDMPVVIGRRYTQYASERDARIKVYANDAAAARAALEAAEHALALYEEAFGPYPWEEIDLVMSQFAQGLRSAPGVLLLNKDLFSLAEREELEYAVALGLAQQFFGEAVGVDPYDEPWLCESVSGLCALLYYEARYGEERMLRELRERVQPALQLTIPGGVAPDSSAAYFNSRSEYEMMLRGRGVAALYELMLAMGREEMLAALRLYYEENLFQTGEIGAFVSACDEASGGSWGLFLTDMLANIGTDAMQTEWY